MLLFFRNETGFGGNNGFTDFKRIARLPARRPATRMALFCVTAVVLLGLPRVPRDRRVSKLGRVLHGHPRRRERA